MKKETNLAPLDVSEQLRLLAKYGEPPCGHTYETWYRRCQRAEWLEDS